MTISNIDNSFPWLTGLAILIAAAIGGYLLHRLLVAVAQRVARRTPSPLDDVLVARLHRPIGLFLPAGAALLALSFISLAPTITPFVRQFLIVLLTLSTGWVVLGLLRAIGDITVARFRIDQPDNLAERQLQTRVLVFRRIGEVIVVVATAALILMIFPSIRHLGISLFASAGVAGIVLGLAARPAIANLIAGIQIALSQPIRVDDVVIVEGEWGWIEEITTTYVVVRIWDQRRLVVPLSYFIEQPFQNWTRKTADIIGTVFLYADYTVPIDRVREELRRLVQGHAKWDGKVCVLQVTNATERTIEMRALVSAGNSSDAWELRCHVREGLIAFLQRDYPQCLPRLRAEISDRAFGAAPSVSD